MWSIAMILEREAGQIIIGLLLLLIGLAASALGYDADRTIVPFALGLLARSIHGQSNGVSVSK